MNANCATGMTASGYTELTRLPISTSSYTDNAIVKNTNYSYVVVVAFTNSKGVDDFSPMSNAACYLIASASPIMTNVSVIKTSTTAGENLVRWTRPVKLDTLQYPGPYSYQLMRAVGTGAFGAIGSPIRGDVKYGFKRGNKDRSIQLHAWKLSFIHPVSNEEVSIEAPLPSDPLWDYFKPFCEKPILPPTQSKE